MVVSINKVVRCFAVCVCVCLSFIEDHPLKKRWAKTTTTVVASLNKNQDWIAFENNKKREIKRAGSQMNHLQVMFMN